MVPTGIKFFALADSTGYLYKFWIYRGAEKAAELNQDARPFYIVTDMLDVVSQDANHIIYADSFYGSAELADALATAGYKFILACRGDRPSEYFNKYLAQRLGKHKWRSMSNEELGVLALSFHDTKKVYINIFIHIFTFQSD
jgi:hypothetical protein